MEGNFYAREVAFQADGTPVYGPPKVLNLISMSYSEVPPRPEQKPPLGIWGPTDPRPTNPIAGFDPIHGTWPELPPTMPESKVAVISWAPADTVVPAPTPEWKPLNIVLAKGSPPITVMAPPYAAPVK